jgi:integrase
MARRNANGEGSIYKRKDGHGRWEGAVSVPTISGKRKRVRVYGRTRAEVREKLTLATAQVLRGTPLIDKSWKVGDYLDYWLENIVTTTLRPTTAQRYASSVRLYLKPILGKYQLTQLTVPIVQALLNNHLASGHSVRSAQIAQTVLSSALTNAEREELLMRNVARLVKLPTYERSDVVPWTKEEVREFVQAIRPERLSVAFLLLIFYGLRRGEVLGLRWQDIDSDRRVIHVRQQVIRHSGTLHVGPLKTKASRRDLPLGTVPALALEQHRTRQAEQNSHATEHDLVFTTSNGSPVDPDDFGRAFRRLCRTNNLRPIKLHHVRHTTATLLKDFGVPARDTQLILGHSNLSTTQEIYQHDSLDSRAVALSNIEKVVNGGSVYMRALPSKLPSNQSILTKLRSIISGSSDRDRTCDLRLMRPIRHTEQDRITSINHAIQVHRRIWKLGCVAVKIAVNDTSPGNSSWRTVGLRERPKAWSP